MEFDAKKYGLSGVYQIKMSEDGEELFIVYDQNGEIVCCQYYAQQRTYGETYQMPIAKEDLPKELKNVLKELDYLYGQGRYFDLAVAMAEELKSGETYGGSLSQCFEYVDWELHADDTMAAYVGIVGEYNFIFYYNRINNQICGFNFGMNPKP